MTRNLHFQQGTRRTPWIRATLLSLQSSGTFCSGASLSGSPSGRHDSNMSEHIGHISMLEIHFPLSMASVAGETVGHR